MEIFAIRISLQGEKSGTAFRYSMPIKPNSWSAWITFSDFGTQSPFPRIPDNQITRFLGVHLIRSESVLKKLVKSFGLIWMDLYHMKLAEY